MKLFLEVALLVFRFVRNALLGARPKPYGKVACKLVVYKCKVQFTNIKCGLQL